ncbi:MAG: hypothetical protein JWN04_2806 [Myxococcaceae bacterium]|nr:hypothetical protein [Myxococcaceae bacterium]
MCNQRVFRAASHLLLTATAALALGCGGDDSDAKPALDAGTVTTTGMVSAADAGILPGSPTGMTTTMHGDASVSMDEPTRPSSNARDPRLRAAPPPPACDTTGKIEQLFQHNGTVSGLALLGETLYFTTFEDGLYAMPKDGSVPPTKVINKYVEDVAVLGNLIYVSGPFYGARFKPEQLAKAQIGEDVPLGSDLRTVNNALYTWSVVGCRFTRFDEGGQQKSLDLPCSTDNVSEQGGTIFTAVNNDPDGIFSQPLAPANDSADKATQIIAEEYIGSELVTTPKHVYFTKYEVSDYEYLMRAPLTGGTGEALVGPLTPDLMVSDGNDIYLSDEGTSCLFRFDDTQTKLTPVAKVGFVEALAFDPQYIYVSTFGGVVGRIKR